MQVAYQLDLYDKLAALPETVVGEILNGQLYTHPRPTGPHALAASRLDADIEIPYGRGRGGPGGWWIIMEPEVHLVRDREVAVPDIAGWRRARMPHVPKGHRFEVVPDWVCEIASPSNAATDRKVKMPLYAHYGVRHAWLVDPGTRTLEAFESRKGKWVDIGRFSGDDRASIPPFDAITIALAELWD